MQNAIYTKSPIFRFLHHLKARDRLNLCVESVVSKRNISLSNRGLKSPMLCRTNAIYASRRVFQNAIYACCPGFVVRVSYASFLMNSNFDFKVDRAGDRVHNKSVSPACRNHYSSSLSRMEEVFDCLDEQVAVSTVGRKRPRNDSARTTAKRARHSGVDKEPVIACQHVAQSFCNAALLTPDDLAANHRCMYGTSDTVTQDQFLTSLLSVSTASTCAAPLENQTKWLVS